MFYCQLVAVMHGRLGSPLGITALAALLSSYILANSISLWVIADARQRGRPLSYDFGSFIFFAWWVVVPIYLFSTRGWRGFIPLGGFMLINFAATIVGSIPVWIVAARP